MLPVAKEYKKILLVEPAVADSITGDEWSRYIFLVPPMTTMSRMSSLNAFTPSRPKA